MISKSAENPLGCAEKLVFTANARTAWGHIIRSFGQSTAPRILLPSYIGYTEREGSGVFDPINETGAFFRFLSVGEGLEIDLDEFQTEIKKNAINLALIIHYFGFCSNQMERIKEFCNSNNVVLVEDCAHLTLLSPDPHSIGSFGDYSIYSIHKHIATNAGGILRINNESINLLTLREEQRASREVLEQLIKTDLRCVAKIRRQNFSLYESLLQSNKNVKPMFTLGENEVPQTFPIRVKNGKREALYFHLLNQRMPTIALYYQLIDEIKKSDFPLSHQISSDILNLPVHQDIVESDVRAVCQGIVDFFKVSEN